MRFSFGECVLDTDEHVLVRGGHSIRLTPKAFQLLTCLVEVRPRAVSKKELLEKLWPATFVSEGNLAGLVNEARSAVGDDARRPLFIRTVHGFGYAFTGRADERTEPTSQSIVVLPVENATGDLDLEYLCDGITENITNALSRLASFRVLSPRTAFRSREWKYDPESIGRKLEVQTVIHGRLRRDKRGFTVQVDAVDVASGTQIWGNRLQADSEHVFRIEEDVAAEVVEALRLRFSESDRSRLLHRFTSNPHAYDLYLRGRFHWNKRTEDGLQKAIELFGRAIVADPEYALPHAGLAGAYVAIGNRDLMPPREAFALALQSATRALELAPTLAEAHASLGAIAEVHEWDWSEAARKYRRAMELSPSYATPYQWYALHLARRGETNEAESQMTTALTLDPLSVIGWTNAALVSYLARDDFAATDRIDRALEIDASAVEAILVRGSIRQGQGDLDAAIADFRAAASQSQRLTIATAFLGHALAIRGQRQEAETLYDQLEAMRQTQYVSAMHLGLLSHGLGRVAEALTWMETALAERSGWLVYLKTERRLDGLQKNERFRRLLDAIGLGSTDHFR